MDGFGQEKTTGRRREERERGKREGKKEKGRRAEGVKKLRKMRKSSVDYSAHPDAPLSPAAINCLWFSGK